MSRARILGSCCALAWLVAAIGCGADETASPPPPPASPSCEPGTTRACYDGPEESLDVGACRSGTQTCAADGRSWLPCTDQQLPTAEVCGDEVDDNCDGHVSCGETSWSRRWGAGRDEAALRIDADGDGNLYVTGLYRDAFALGAGLPASNTSRDVFVAKLGPDGAPSWSLGLFGDGHLLARDVAVSDEGLVAVVASYPGSVQIGAGSIHQSEGGNDIVVAVLDAAGNELWSGSYGDEDEQHPTGVAFDGDGGLVVTGFFRGQLDFGDAPLSSSDPHYDVFLAKLSAEDGTPMWTRAFAGDDDDIPRRLALGPQGSIHLVGYFQADVDFGSGALLSRGDDDVFVASFDGDGTPRWALRFGDEAEQRAFGVAVDAQGFTAVSGRFEGTLEVGADRLESVAGNLFVARIDAAGEPLWGRQLPGAAGAAAYDVAVGMDGRLVVSGYYEGQPELDGQFLPQAGVREPAIAVIKLETNGSRAWARGIVVTGDQTVSGTFRAWRALTLLPDDSIAIAGAAEGPIDFGDGVTLMEGGSADLIVARLLP